MVQRLLFTVIDYTDGNKGLENAHFDESISFSNTKLNVWRRIDYFLLNLVMRELLIYLL